MEFKPITVWEPIRLDAVYHIGENAGYEIERAVISIKNLNLK